MKDILFIVPSLTVLFLFSGSAFSQDPPKAESLPKTSTSPGLAKQLSGRWRIVAIGDNGRQSSDKESAELAKRMHVEITAEWILLITQPKSGGEAKTEKMKWTLDESHAPAWIDLEILRGGKPDPVKSPGICELKDDTLRICFPDHPHADTPRANAFKTEKGTANDFLLILQRMPAEDLKPG